MEAHQGALSLGSSCCSPASANGLAGGLGDGSGLAVASGRLTGDQYRRFGFRRSFTRTGATETSVTQAGPGKRRRRERKRTKRSSRVWRFASTRSKPKTANWPGQAHGSNRVIDGAKCAKPRLRSRQAPVQRLARSKLLPTSRAASGWVRIIRPLDGSRTPVASPIHIVVASNDAALASLTFEAAGDQWRVESCSDLSSRPEFLTRPELKLIVLDDAILGSADSFAALDRLHQSAPDTPVIYIAARHSPETEKFARAGGVHHYTSKPIDAERFAQVLKSFLNFRVSHGRRRCKASRSRSHNRS